MIWSASLNSVLCGAAAFAEAEAICTQPCTAVASAVAQVPAVYECAAGNPTAATAAARAQAPALAPGPLVTHPTVIRSQKFFPALMWPPVDIAVSTLPSAFAAGLNHILSRVRYMGGLAL